MAERKSTFFKTYFNKKYNIQCSFRIDRHYLMHNIFLLFTAYNTFEFSKILNEILYTVDFEW